MYHDNAWWTYEIRGMDKNVSPAKIVYVSFYGLCQGIYRKIEMKNHSWGLSSRLRTKKEECVAI